MRLELVPAIDLRGGRCVRLLHGDPAQETRYDEDPVARARSFVRSGATRLHVVDLDGAFGAGENSAALAAIARAVDVPVQTGGGIRTLADVRARFGCGAATVILGTLAALEPVTARAIVAEFADRAIVGVDARGRSVAVRGWLEDGGLDRDAFVREIAAWGTSRIVYTEIARDGAGTGFDVAALAHVAALAPLRVTASGGAKTIDDLRELAAGTPANVDAAIVGRALYDGTIDLEAALAVTAALP